MLVNDVEGVRERNLVVLVRSDGDELSLGKHEGPERTVGKFEEIVGSHHVQPRLVFMHGVQNGLKQETWSHFWQRIF